MIHNPILRSTILPISHDPTQNPNFDNFGLGYFSTSVWYLNNFEQLVIQYYFMLYHIIHFFFFIDLHTSKHSTFVLELSKLSNLEQLKLDASSIDKSLLHKIGVMTSLNVLTMSNCGLNGTLPDQGRLFFIIFLFFYLQ